MREEDLKSTISATFAMIRVAIHEEGNPGEPAMLRSVKETIKLQLWDTVGDEKLRHITRNYYNGASAAIIVYDVTNRSSLQVAAEWIEDVRQNVPSNCFIAVVGNKIDLLDQIEVLRKTGENFAENNHCDAFFETSAKENRGIRELFEKVAKEVSSRRLASRPTSTSLRP